MVIQSKIRLSDNFLWLFFWVCLLPFVESVYKSEKLVYCTKRIKENGEVLFDYK